MGRLTMIVVIRNGQEATLKTNFILQLLSTNSNIKVLRVYRNENRKFDERWDNTGIDLATSVSGIVANFLLMFLKSPRDLRNGMLARLSSRRRVDVLFSEGFLSTLAQSLNFCFATSARTDRLMFFLNNMKVQKIFLVDEFWSINTVDLQKLKNLGVIVYVSQDVAYNRYGFQDNSVARKLMYRLEKKAVAVADLVIACSERDMLTYVEMGARKTVFYPNIYPIARFEPYVKDQSPSLSIVLRGHWGKEAIRSLKEVFEALSHINKEIKVYMIGVKTQKVSKNIDLQHLNFIPNKLSYLRILSKSWIGINIGIHMAGANERKYDYAMAGLVVFSDKFGARGDLLPHEYTYVDGNDLAAKLNQLLDFSKRKISEMGLQNRTHAISLADKQRKKITNLLIPSD